MYTDQAHNGARSISSSWRSMGFHQGAIAFNTNAIAVHVVIHDEEIRSLARAFPRVIRFLVRVENRHFAHLPHTAIPREDIQYVVPERMPLLPCVLTSLIEGALLTRESNHPNSKVLFRRVVGSLFVHLSTH